MVHRREVTGVIVLPIVALLLAVAVAACRAEAGSMSLDDSTAPASTSPLRPPAPTRTVPFAPAASPGSTPAPLATLVVADPPSPSPSPTVTTWSDPNALPPGLDPALATELAAARHLWREGDLAGALTRYQSVTARPGAPAVAVLERGEVELAGGDATAAATDGTRLLRGNDPTLQARARVLVANADLALGKDDQVARLIDSATAPDGLADLAVLLRAQAAAKANQPAVARRELAREELRDSTNRVILEQAGQLAEGLDDYGLAASLEARAGTFQGWAADRTRVIQAAARDAAKADQSATEVAEDRLLIEGFGWTPAAAWAASDLRGLGALGAYDQGLAALAANQEDVARAAFLQAENGPDAAAARQRLAALDDSTAWGAARSANTVDAYHSFRTSYPTSPHAGDALFAEGLLHYEAGQYAEAVTVWSVVSECRSDVGAAPSPAVACAADGDSQARRLLWSGKALLQLGRGDEARADWRKAADSHPTGYYALRARDLLAGANGWPAVSAPALPVGAKGTDVETWLTSWAGTPTATTAAEASRVERGLGLLAVGNPSAATAELNGVIADTRNPWLLYRLADTLAKDELWSSSARAANRLVSLAPDKSVPDAPLAVQRLAYPAAYLDLVRAQAGARGVDSLLFLSLMYQESADDPLARSLAGALGLTQVMPSTGRDVAAAIGLKGFTPDNLERPDIAIQLGVWYFANQLRLEGGDPFRALAAYNAGAGPIARWASADPDLFVERISYPETKDYVRKIYVHFDVYRSLRL